MPASYFTTTSKDGITLTAYPGDGAVLLGYSLDQDVLQNKSLAGFSIQCIPPVGQPYYIPNRLHFTYMVTSGTTPDQRVWTPSDKAPFQKFHWVHFPAEVLPGPYRYKVTARFWQGLNMADGPSAEVSVELIPEQLLSIEFGFTRGYLTSQAYAGKFNDKDIRPESRTLDYDTRPFEAQYQWLGFHARRMIFDFLRECVDDPSITVDLSGNDLDEPDILKMLESLGPRLRVFLDNAPFSVGSDLKAQAHHRLVQSAGAENVRQGHFRCFAHDKIIIQKKKGKAVKVMTGSANFSVQGLYVHANKVLVFNDPAVARLYAQAFEKAFKDMKGFLQSALARKWFDFPGKAEAPIVSVTFAPHADASISVDKVKTALENAKSSVLFAVMEGRGGGDILDALRQLHLSGKVFSYGITQSDAGFIVYKPGQPGVLVPFTVLDKHVTRSFNKEWRGGPGQAIHDKFIVIDFNDENPVIFTGPSNLAKGGDESNCDNLLAIHDKKIAAAFAVGAMRLVDHYHFRAAMQAAASANPLMLSFSSSGQKWYARDYDENDMHSVLRLLLASGPSSVTAVPREEVAAGAEIEKVPAAKKKTIAAKSRQKSTAKDVKAGAGKPKPEERAAAKKTTAGEAKPKTRVKKQA